MIGIPEELVDEYRQSNGHDRNDVKSRVYGHLVSQKLVEDPEYVIRKGLENIESWDRSSYSESLINKWERCLHNKNISQIKHWLTSQDEESKQLRQSHPFPGVIPFDKRDAIWRKLEQTA